MIKQAHELLERVRQDDLGKHDITVPVQRLVVRDNGNIVLPSIEGVQGIGHYGLTDHALGQLSTRLGIPTRYAKKCMETEPELFAHHANYWIETPEWEEKSWFMRGQGDMIRGVLSDRYTTLDNHFVVEMLNNVLGDGGVVDIKNMSLDPQYFNLRLVFPDMNWNLGTSNTRDDVMVGVHITNSEVGSSSLRIDSCLFRLVCSNGMIARVGGESLMAQRHVHLTNSEMENRVAGAITEAIRLGDSTIDKFARLRDVKVSDPLEEIKRLAKQEKYSEKFTDNLLQSFTIEQSTTGNYSAYELVNAFTRSAQNMPTFDRRLEVEQYAGKLMDTLLK